MKKYELSSDQGLLAPAYVANGFIGFRFKPDTFDNALPGRLSGYDRHQKGDISTCAPVPTPSIRLYADGLLLQKEQRRFVKQTYDFSCGELETEYVLERRDRKKIGLKHLIFCSRTSPSLLVYQLTLTADNSMNLGVESVFTLPDENTELLEDNLAYAKSDFALLISGDGGRDLAGIASLITAEGIELTKQDAVIDEKRKSVSRRAVCAVEANTALRICIATSYIPSCMHTEPQQQALREIKLFLWEGFASVRDKNKAAWKDIWESRVEIDGDSIMQETADASLFYMMSTVHPSAPVSIGPFGLSSDGYYGHAFWDTESFMFMVPLLIEPAAAEALLEYRYERLGMAKNNAKINGYRGAQYPWQSGKYGDEVCPAWAGQAGGAGEQHINMDVAMAFVAYCRVTGDEIFMKEKAWPVLREIAAWICSRVTKTRRGYEIFHVCGIDESSDNVDNDAYTNIMCRKVLFAACDMAKKLGYTPKKEWLDVAENLILPIDPEKQYVKQHENAVIQPIMDSSTLMAFFPYGFTHSPEVDENTLKMHLSHGFDDGLRLPMLSNFLGVFPAMVGDRAFARRIYDDVRERFFVEPYLASSECGTAKEYIAKGKLPATTFLTARGSLLCGLMMGLTRMDFWQGDAAKWFTRRVTLPEGWNKLTLGKIYIEGRPAKVTARDGEIPQIDWLDETPSEP